MRYIECEIGALGLGYFRRVMECGGQLASSICDVFDLSKGRIIAYLPESVHINEQAQLECGGVADPDRTLKWLACTIRNLATNKPSIVLAFDSIHRPHDPILSSVDARLMLHDTDVYFGVAYEEIDTKRLTETIRFAEHQQTFYGMLISTVVKLPERGAQRCVSSTEIDELTKDVHVVFASAFDGEGYLLWYPVKPEI